MSALPSTGALRLRAGAPAATSGWRDVWLQPSCGRTAARVCYAAGKESWSADSTTITEAGDDREVPGVTGFWCTDGYAVCGYAEAAATSKDIVVSVDDMGVSKTPGLRVNAPPSADHCSAGRGDRAFRIESLARSSFLEA
eukprot:COSAG04_NODE_2412_length_4181_cov_3.810877_2_plen_140_part_00